MHRNSRSYNSYKKRTSALAPRRKSFKAAHFKALTILALLIALGVHVHAGRQASAQAQAAAETAHTKTANSEFARTVNTVISDNPQIGFSVSIISSHGTGPLCFGSCQPQDAASTAKLITAAAYLHKVESGQAGLAYKINNQSAADELRLLINRSDDGAWQAFNDRLGHPYLQDYAHNIGLYSYSAEDNTISSFDMARLLKLLWAGELLNSSHTKQLLSYMQHTNYEDFMPPAVLPGFNLYHKVGINGDQVNDAGTINSQSGNIFLSIFTNGHGIYNWEDRAALMQRITKAAEKAYL